jgi:hypothetical protein
MALARFVVHRLPAFLHQEVQQTSLHGVGMQRAQPFAVSQQQIQQGFGVAGVALGSGRSKGLPVTCGRGGVNREQHQVRVLGEHIHQRPARLLQNHRNGLTAKPLL